MSSLSYPRIILFGDSLTQKSFSAETNGFGTALSNAYVRKADILNRGFSGYNSRWLLPLFHQTLRNIEETLTSPVLLFTIFVGANDACLPGHPQHVPLDEYKSNLRTMITELRTCPATSASTKVLVLTPPPIDPVMLEKRGESAGRRLYRKTEEYAIASRGVAAEFEEDAAVACLDVHTILVEEARGRSDAEKINLDGILCDGLHFDSEGYAILFREVMKTLKEKWPDILPENLALFVSSQTPLWGDIVAGLNTPPVPTGH